MTTSAPKLRLDVHTLNMAVVGEGRGKVWLRTIYRLVLSRASKASSDYKINEDQQIPLDVVDRVFGQMEKLAAEHEMTKSDLDQLSANIASLELKQNMALLNESSRLREEFQSLRALIQAMQMQIVYSFDARRKEKGAVGNGSGSPNNFPPKLGGSTSGRHNFKPTQFSYEIVNFK
ncbi:hypothetical protein HK102_013909 [Quaeritorhiza haematococci]|nr:hypothetical protein HK102_013909 [Quaeritorhiza haematococci]